MLFSTNKTLMQHIIDKEKKNFLQTTKIQQTGTENPFIDSNVLYEVNINNKSLKTLSDKYFYLTDLEEVAFLNYEDYFKDVTDKIIKIKSYGKLKQMLSTIDSTQRLLGKQFAGALLLNGKDIINPLHPLTALCILNNIEEYENIDYKLIIFTYKNRENLDNIYASGFGENMRDLYNENVIELLGTFHNRPKDRQIEIIKNDMYGDESISQQYALLKGQEEEQDNEYFLVAHQITTKGIVAPHYGTSIIKFNCGINVGGRHMTPWRSGNISCSLQRDGDYQIENTKLNPLNHMNSVCTGTTSNNTFTGLRTLTHSNQDSAYTTSLLADGALIYAEVCIERSLEMYKTCKLINKDYEL